MELDISVTFAGIGFDPDDGDRALSALTVLAPDAGPVVSQNTKTGTLTLTMTFDVPDGSPDVAATAAMEHAKAVVLRTLTDSGLEPTDVVDVDAHVAARDMERALVAGLTLAAMSA